MRTAAVNFGLFLVVLCAMASVNIEAQAQQAPPAPGPEHKMLLELVGTWDVDFYMIGVEQPSKCVAKYTSECGGLWVASDFQGDLGGLKFSGRGLDGYDTAKKKFVSVWVDSMITAPMLFEGNYDEAKKTLTQSATAPGGDGKPAKWRSVTKIVDSDHHDFEMFVTPEGGAEMKMFTVKYTRRK